MLYPEHMPTVRLTFEPWREVFVSEDEYLRLLRQGLIFTGATPPPPPAFTDAQYAELANPDGEAAKRVIEAVGESSLISGVTAAVTASIAPDIAAANSAATSANENANGRLAKTQNLNDLSDKMAARTNLNVYGKSDVYTKGESDLTVIAAREKIEIDAGDAKWGIPMTGAADAKPAAAALIAAAPKNARIRWHGVLRFDSFLTRPPEKFLVNDWTDAYIIRNHSGFLMRSSATFGTPFVVTTNVTASKPRFGQTITFTRLTLDGVPLGWKAGDLLRIVGDDPQPSSRYLPTATDKPRVAEWVEIESIDGAVVDLAGVVMESYTDNVRVFPVANTGSVRDFGGTWDVSDKVLGIPEGGGAPVAANRLTGGGIRNIGLIDPQVHDQIVERDIGQPISMRACYRYKVENQYLKYAMNAPEDSPSIVGYGVLDQGSMYGYTDRLRTVDGRHSWTDVSSETPANGSDPTLYGATMLADIHGADVNATGNSGIDTHHGSLGITYHAPVIRCAPGAKSAAGLRGRYHRILDPDIYGGENGVHVFDDTTGSGAGTSPESYGHYVRGMRLNGTRRAVAVTLRTTGHGSVGVRSPETNITVEGVTGVKVGGIYRVENGRAKIRAADLELASAISGRLMENLNAFVDFEGIFDGSRVTSFAADGSTPPQIEYSSQSDVRLKLQFSHSAALMAALGTAEPFYNETNTERADFDVVFENPWTATENPFRIQAAIAKARLRWRILPDANDVNTRQSSTTLQVKNANLASTAYPARLLRSDEPTLTLFAFIDDSTARDLAALPVGKYIGQVLVIYNIQANATFKVKHGATYLTTLASGTDVTVAPGQELRLRWTGTRWTQPVAL